MASQEDRDRIVAEYLASVEDDDDEDAEFEPGDTADDDNQVIVLKGSLTVLERHLVFKGTSSTGKEFAINSQPLHINLMKPTEEKENGNEIPKVRNITMEGVLEGRTRKINLTIASIAKSSKTEKCAGEEQDCKLPADKSNGKIPAKESEVGGKDAVFSFLGSGDGFEFHGEYIPKSTERNTLECTYENKYRKQTKAPASGTMAVASKLSSDSDGDWDEDDDDIVDADEGIDVEELMDLHKDMGNTMPGLKRRRRNGASTPEKRTKREDDDENDIGF